MLNPRLIDQALTAASARMSGPSGPSGVSRRAFVTTTVGGMVGLALLPGVLHAQGAAKPGSKPTEQPQAFIHIARDGTTRFQP